MAVNNSLSTNIVYNDHISQVFFSPYKTSCIVVLNKETYLVFKTAAIATRLPTSFWLIFIFSFILCYLILFNNIGRRHRGSYNWHNLPGDRIKGKENLVIKRSIDKQSQTSQVHSARLKLFVTNVSKYEVHVLVS